MHNLLNYIDKAIVNITTAEELGCFKNIAVRDMDIEYFITESNLHIPVEDICGTGDYIACVSNGTRVDNSIALTEIGKKAVLINGTSLGEILDYTFTNKWKLNCITTESCTISAEKIASVGKDYLVINKKTTKPPKKTSSPIHVQIDMLESKDTILPVPTSAIPKVVSDYSFLCGRVLSRDIYLGNGKRLFCAYTSITENIINLAKINNKLVELTLYSQKMA